MTQALQVGDLAPSLDLFDQAGERVALSAFWKNGPAVVFFYPRDDTPGCTEQACTFRDRFDEFVTLGAEVVGISSDSVASHARFAQKHGLAFRLLSDPDQAARHAFGVPKSLVLLPGRVTYVIDGGGVVRHVFNSLFNAKDHIEEAVSILKSLPRPS